MIPLKRRVPLEQARVGRGRVRGYKRVGVPIGEFCYCGGLIDTSKVGVITIGSYVTLAVQSALLIHGPTRGDSKGISIWNNVFVGYGAYVGAGVVIGNNVIIGLGSVVVNDIPSNSVAAGNPTRVLRPIRLEEALFHFKVRKMGGTLYRWPYDTVLESITPEERALVNGWFQKKAEEGGKKK